MKKQKNLISYERYSSMKNRQPDYLCNAINKHKYATKIEQSNTGGLKSQQIKHRIIQKHIQNIKKIHKYNKISPPQAYIKRTWVSPLDIATKKQQFIHYSWKKTLQLNYYTQWTPQQNVQKVCKIMNINKNMRLFGQYMYSQIEQKQNIFSNEKEKYKKGQIKHGEGKLDIMHKQYIKIMNQLKKVVFICSKDSQLNKIKNNNPLLFDKYYHRIMRKNDQLLSNMLLDALSVSSNFTFTSYIQFYELFIWQQASKQTQIEFVVKLLMHTKKSIELKQLAKNISFLCERISLDSSQASLQGFDNVMIKLIFGNRYQKYLGDEEVLMTKEQLKEGLQANQECISIFINVFYAE